MCEKRIPSVAQGTKIYCKNNHLVATVNRDIYKGDAPYKDAFDYADNQTAPTKGQTEPPSCFCGEPWFDLNKRNVINKPIPPINRIICDWCGELDAPDFKHKNWLCRFFAGKRK